MKGKRLQRLASRVLSCLLAVALVMTFLPVTALAAAPSGSNKIQNDQFWKTVDGKTIYSQGGGIFEFGDKYYWYGVEYEESSQYANSPTKSYSENHFKGVTCYSSTDLVNWTFEGYVVKPEEISKREEMEGAEVAWVGRLGVAKVDDTYVLLVQHECDDPDNSLDGDTDKWSKQVLVLTCDSPTGEFKWNQRINMKRYTAVGGSSGTSNTGDQTVFTDPKTGNSYLVYSYGSGRAQIFLSKIVNMGNGLYGPSLEETYRIYHGAGREGDCMFYYNDAYYVCASDLYGWNASHAYYLKLDSLDPAYLKSHDFTNMAVMPGCSDDYCHVTQTGFFYTVQGSKQQTVIFCGDRWADFANNGLGYNQWCPLSFTADGTPYFNSLSSWHLDAKTGEWSVAEDNNYVKNGSFDADRINLSQMVGWTNTVVKGNSPINNNGSNHTTGKYGLALGDSVDFNATISQVIQSNSYVKLPDGSYTLTAKMKNSHAFDNLQLYGKSNGTTVATTVSGTNSNWTEITVKDIPVSGGKVEIGITAEGAGGSYAYIDDITLVRTGDLPTAGTAITVDLSFAETLVGRTLTLTAKHEDGTVYTYEVVLTADMNTFTMTPVKAGTYTVSADMYGAKVTATGADKVVVEDGKAATGITIAIEDNAGTLTGKVVSETGAALAGVTVTLTGEAETIQTVTDANGAYTFENVTAGSYQVKFEKEAYETVGPIEVTVEVGKTTELAEQTLKMNAATISGTVYGVDGQPAANVDIVLRGNSSRDDYKRYYTKTDASGRYSQVVVPGPYQIVAVPYNYSAKILNSSNVAALTNVTAEPDEDIAADLQIPTAITVPNGEFENSFKGTDWVVQGTVSGQKNRAQDSHSGNCHFNVYSVNGSFTVSQTLTLENGTYVFNVSVDGEPKDDDELYIWAKNSKGEIIARQDVPNNYAVNNTNLWEIIGFVVDVQDGSLTIGISGSMPGSHWAHIDEFRAGKFEALESGISGQVYGVDGKPVANATVHLRRSDSISDTTRLTTTTDENGHYTFGSVAKGTYALNAYTGSNAYATVNAIAQNVVVTSNGALTTVDLQIPEEIAIVNGGFEMGNGTGWTTLGSSGKVSNDKNHGHVHTGSYGYTTWKGDPFTVDLEQVLTGLEDGTYTVQAMIAAGTFTEGTTNYLYAKNEADEILSQENVPLTVNDAWELIGLTAEVTGGTLRIGVEGSLPGGAWMNLDDFKVGRLPTEEEPEEPVDKTELEAAIAKADEVDTELYTEESLAVLTKALEDAKAVLESEEATQEDVDAAAKALLAAIDALETKPEPTPEPTPIPNPQTVRLVIYRNGNTSVPYTTVTLPQVGKGETLDLSKLNIKEYYTLTDDFTFEGYYNDGGWNSYKNGNKGNTLGDTIVINGWTNLMCMVTDAEPVPAPTPAPEEKTQTVQLVIYRNGDTAKAYTTVTLPKMAKGEALYLDTLDIDKYYTAPNGFTFEGWYNDHGWNQYKAGNKDNTLGDAIVINGWTNIMCMVTDKPEEIVEYVTVSIKSVINGDKGTAQAVYTGKVPKGANLIETLDAMVADGTIKIQEMEDYIADTWYNWDWFGHKHGATTTFNGWTNVYINYIPKT